jgi:hypothetical protein
MIWEAQETGRDTIRDVLQQVFAAPEYQWDISPGLLDTLRGWWDSLIAVLDGLRDSHPAAYTIVLICLVFLLFAILGHMSFVVWRVLRPRLTRHYEQQALSVATHDADWHLGQARDAIREGRFVEALGLRFRALVLRLDGRGSVVFHQSKTPAEYLDEEGLTVDDRGALSLLVQSLYLHLFGGAPCTEREVRAFDESASALEGRSG